MRETNGSFDSVNSCIRLDPSSLHHCMSYISQNLCLFHMSNLSVINFRILLPMYPGCLSRCGDAGRICRSVGLSAPYHHQCRVCAVFLAPRVPVGPRVPAGSCVFSSERPGRCVRPAGQCIRPGADWRLGLDVRGGAGRDCGQRPVSCTPTLIGRCRGGQSPLSLVRRPQGVLRSPVSLVRRPQGVLAVSSACGQPGSRRSASGQCQRSAVTRASSSVSVW